MPNLHSIFESVSGNAVWDLIKISLGSFIVIRIRKALVWLREWASRVIHRRSAQPTVEGGKRTFNWDALGTVFLVIALLLMGLWNEKLEYENHILHVQMTRYVLPRQLTKTQIEVFGKYLREHSQPQEVIIRYINGDSEVGGYAEAFAAAFRAGNWAATQLPFQSMVVKCPKIPPPDDNPQFLCFAESWAMANSFENVTFQKTGPNPPRSTIEEKLHPSDISTVLDGALRNAGILDVSITYGNNSDPLNTVTVYVGTRPRGKWAVLPPQVL